ncbi:MAG: tRNA (guanosine(37)-N1)-methyltransferase TrmD [Firmicutes bacterium]|nr:tRNA (guanosine(37)-N1)-methyltransferase TrmD [Bacillota bacterium]
MKIHVLTLFPEMFAPVTTCSMLGRAGEKGILNIDLINIRDYSNDKHNKADDTPFGGGVGMVMLADPIFGALQSIGPVQEVKKKRILYMSPRGKQLDQSMIENLVTEEELVILCGHYEGVDQRVLDYWDMEEVTIGDYILTGGELPAMVLIDAVSRFIPGVLGTQESATDESIYSGLLECDQYTKPREYAGMLAPEVLWSGNHKLIHLWQFENALRLTRERRPDLFAAWLEKGQAMTKEEKKILEKILSAG